ncbi:MAG: response regulator transcription factor [Roseiflexaceae bacterium]|nr:response regulator transcription factor [Roseiflexaceae bacterium]
MLRRSLRAPASFGPRAAQVAALLTLGDSNKAIAEQLHTSARTIEGEIQRMCSETGVDNRAALAAWCMRWGERGAATARN